MKIQLSNQQIRELYFAINKVKEVPGRKFVFCIVKNQDRLLKHVLSIQDDTAAPKDFEKYTDEVKLLHTSHVLKDEDGREKETQDEYGNRVFDYDPTMAPAMKVLNKKYKDEIANQFDNEIMNTKYLMENREIDIYEYIGEMPDITLFQLDSIIWLMETSEAIGKSVLSTIPVRFSRQAVLDYRKVFQCLSQVTHKPFLEIFKANLFLLRSMALEFVTNKSYQDFYDIHEVQRNALIRKHAIIDMWGEPITRNIGNNSLEVVMKNQEAFDAAYEKLAEKNKDIIKAKNDFLNEVISLDLVSLTEELLWEDINAKQMKALLEFIA